MPSQVIVPYAKMTSRHDEIEKWLKDNAGLGSVRYGGRENEIKHWLNGDDWLYYNAYLMGDQDKLTDSSTVFIFKDERVATEFALRFA